VQEFLDSKPAEQSQIQIRIQNKNLRKKRKKTDKKYRKAGAEPAQDLAH
jgi:hypothetical protein